MKSYAASSLVSKRAINGLIMEVISYTDEKNSSTPLLDRRKLPLQIVKMIRRNHNSASSQVRSRKSLDGKRSVRISFVIRPER
jgi:hypothetical protein